MSESTFESALSRRRLLQGAGAVVASVGVSPWLAEATAFGAENKVGGESHLREPLSSTTSLLTGNRSRTP